MSAPNPYAGHKVAESSLFLKLADGQTQTIRIATEPYIFQSKFVRGEEEKWSTRYAWVVFNRDQMKAQILQLSPTAFKQIQALAVDENWGDPVGYDVKITRTGTGTDTVYTVLPVPNKTPISPPELEHTNKVEITKVSGLEHALPLSQVSDGSNAPKPAGEEDFGPEINGPAGEKKKDVIIEDLPDDGPVNLDEIPF